MFLAKLWNIMVKTLRIQTLQSVIQGSNPILNVSQDSPGFLGNLFIFTMWATKKPLLLSIMLVV